MRGLTGKLASILGSRRFYWLVIGFFAFEALWIALSANYPMAFDEDFHLGVIKIYSEQWSPFLSGQPDGGNQFGALAVDPSYLYHYLMSFPYRLIALVTDNLMTQVAFLRLINIGLMAGGVILFGKVLRRAGTSQLLTNTATLLFALVPAVVLLAGQINYDNLFVLALAWVCLLTLKITEDLKTRTVNLRTFVLLAVGVMLASLVKYAFLPLALVVFVYVVYMVWRAFRRHDLWVAVAAGYRDLSKKLRIGLAVVLVVSAGLFAQRYAVNMLTYHNPVPDCAQVLSIESCMEYGPWGRNYRYTANMIKFDRSPISYTWLWLQGLHYRLFFMITGPPTHTNYPPSPLPSVVAIVVLLFGVIALPFYWRQIFAGRPFLLFLFLAAVVYAVFLWAFSNYPQYLETGRPVAINGRYFIPLLLPLAAVLGRALSVALRPWESVRVWAAVVAIVLSVQGGGLFGFILRSDKAWYWPNRTTVLVNDTARSLLDPIIFQGPKKY